MSHRAIAATACAFCRRRKKKCDGGEPCAMCVKYRAQCEYPKDRDKRKWKFDSTYVDYLELRVDLLDHLCEELARSNPGKARLIGMDQLKRPSAPPDDQSKEKSSMSMGEQLAKSLAHEDAVDELVNTKWRVRQQSDDITEFYGPVSGRQQVEESLGDDSEMMKNHGIDLVSVSTHLRTELLRSFQVGFAQYFIVCNHSIDEIYQWEFPNPDLSKHLLLSSIFTYASTYNHQHLTLHFLYQAQQLVLKASRQMNDYTLQALLILSCFELGRGMDSNSWVNCVMGTSMVQYLGLHLAPKHTASSENSLVRGKHDGAVFWSMILQDRIITSVLGRGARIQYFRVSAPFYTPLLSNLMDQSLSKFTDDDINEITFAIHTKVWFIHDKFLGQIFSSKAEHLHSSHRLALVDQGMESVKQLQTTIPAQLKKSEDHRVLILQLSFSVTYLLLNRAYLNQTPLKVILTIIKHCEISSVILSKLIDRFIQDKTRIPYFVSYLVLTCSTFEMFLMTNKDQAIQEAAKLRVLTSVRCLEIISEVWPRGEKDLKVLNALAKRWKLELPCPSLHDYQDSAGVAVDDENDITVSLDGSLDHVEFFMNQFMCDSGYV